MFDEEFTKLTEKEKAKTVDWDESICTSSWYHLSRRHLNDIDGLVNQYMAATPRRTQYAFGLPIIDDEVIAKCATRPQPALHRDARIVYCDGAVNINSGKTARYNGSSKTGMARIREHWKNILLGAQDGEYYRVVSGEGWQSNIRVVMKFPQNVHRLFSYDAEAKLTMIGASLDLAGAGNYWRPQAAVDFVTRFHDAAGLVPSTTIPLNRAFQPCQGVGVGTGNFVCSNCKGTKDSPYLALRKALAAEEYTKKLFVRSSSDQSSMGILCLCCSSHLKNTGKHATAADIEQWNSTWRICFPRAPKDVDRTACSECSSSIMETDQKTSTWVGALQRVLCLSCKGVLRSQIAEAIIAELKRRGLNELADQRCPNPNCQNLLSAGTRTLYMNIRYCGPCGRYANSNDGQMRSKELCRKGIAESGELLKGTVLPKLGVRRPDRPDPTACHDCERPGVRGSHRGHGAPPLVRYGLHGLEGIDWTFAKPVRIGGGTTTVRRNRSL